MRNLRVLFLTLAAAILATPAVAQKVEVTDRDCSQLVAATPRPDVNYQPGVDVYGRSVAPADLNPQTQFQPPQNFTFDANIDLKKYGISSNSPLLLPSMSVGKISVEDGGRRVYFNGQPLGDTDQRALADLCRQRQQQQRR
jgi:hypothetical protein